MADSAETGSDAQITFKVKSSNDKTHTITMDESATVLDLKTKLAGADFEDIPADRQRLIYSGRIMKDSDALSVYKIKHMNTVHMVKSARSNAQPAAASGSTSTPTPAAVPQNMAAGSVAGDPLAGLTGARFAGHANLPSADLFGADGGVSSALLPDLNGTVCPEVADPWRLVLDGCAAERGPVGRHAIKPDDSTDNERSPEQSQLYRHDDSDQPRISRHAECARDAPVAVLPQHDDEPRGNSHGVENAKSATRRRGVCVSRSRCHGQHTY